MRRLLLKSLLIAQNKLHLRHARPRLVGFAFDHITAKVHIDGRLEGNELNALETLLFPKLAKGGVCPDIGSNIGNHAETFGDFFPWCIRLSPSSNGQRYLRKLRRIGKRRVILFFVLRAKFFLGHDVIHHKGKDDTPTDFALINAFHLGKCGLRVPFGPFNGA